MPRQNRVNPFGDIIATPERGAFMGNRGILHNAEGRIRRAWQVKRWLVCVLEFRGRKRTVMTPGRYTELFFLDEATALAAGHRPCAECRHARFLAFSNAWKVAHPGEGNLQRPTATEIDTRMHVERVTADRSKRSYTSALDEMPDGVFVTLEGWAERAYLVWGDSLFTWSPGGYKEGRPRPNGVEVRVLTPQLTVAAIRAGYPPEVDASVRKST
jgi:hypothetical protein